MSRALATLAIGSETKSMTALAIMLLSEKGSLSLDPPVQSYLLWFRVAQADYSRLITVRELLEHTSGLPPSAPFDTPVTSVAIVAAKTGDKCRGWIVRVQVHYFNDPCTHLAQVHGNRLRALSAERGLA